MIQTSMLNLAQLAGPRRPLTFATSPTVQPSLNAVTDLHSQLLQAVQQLSSNWSEMASTPTSTATPAPAAPNAGKRAQVDENGAFLPGGDLFNMGGKEYSANQILSKYDQLSPEQQTAVLNDPLIINALAVRMGRAAWAPYIQERSAGGKLYTPGSGYDPATGMVVTFNSKGQRQQAFIGPLY